MFTLFFKIVLCVPVNVFNEAKISVNEGLFSGLPFQQSIIISYLQNGCRCQQNVISSNAIFVLFYNVTIHIVLLFTYNQEQVLVFAVYFLLVESFQSLDSSIPHMDVHKK